MRGLFIALATLISIAAWPSNASAQEAISSSGTESTSSTSSSAPSSGGSTTDLSAGGSSGASTGAVSSAPSTSTAAQIGGAGGVGVFSPTPIKLYLNVFGGYDDNVNTNLGAKQGSSYTGGNLILDYTFGDPRLQVILNGGAGGVYYLEHVNGQDYDIDLKGALGINYKASPRLAFGTTLLLDYLTEPNFDNPGGLNSRNGNYFYTTDTLFVTYAWSRRFNTKTSFSIEAFKYENEPIAIFSDRVGETFGNEFQLQLVPTTKLVAEYRYNIVNYANDGEIVIPAQFNIFGMQIAPPVRLQNDSTTQFALAGIDHVFNPRFTGSLRGGAQFRSYDSGGDRTGPYFEGTLSYAVGRRTSVSWNSRYGLEEPEIAGAQSRTTFRTGLHAKFDVTAHVSSTMDAYYVHDDYHSLTTGTVPVAAFSDDTFDIGFSVRYAITPQIAVQAGYHYTDITSDMASREYSRNRFSGGMSFTF